MKVIFVGDAVVSSGFARATHAACDALYAAGHDVTVLGINWWGDPHPYPYPLYPCVNPHDKGRDQFGVSRLPQLVDRLHPDLVVLLNDPWNIDSYMRALGDRTVPVVAWLAVDARNQHGETLNRLAHAITWTQFGAIEIVAGGYKGQFSIVPLGVDLSIFNPKPHTLSREAVFSMIPESGRPALDSFIVGVVGRNQFRKRLDLTIAYFAEWVKGCNIDDAYLYLHVAPTGDSGVDIASLVQFYGVSGKVIMATPDIGKGDPTASLPYLYSSFDVYLSTTQGEGWGLPALEAMACGVPCVLPDFAAFGPNGWVEQGSAFLIPCPHTEMTAPMNSMLHTIGAVPDRKLTINALNALYRDPGLRDNYRQRGIEKAAQYPWSRVGGEMVAVLEAVANRAPTVESSTVVGVPV